MKQKTALLILALFIVSMAPVAFAYESDDDAGYEDADYEDDSSGDDDAAYELEKEPAMMKGGVEKLKVMGKRLVLAKDLRERQDRRLKVRDAIEKTRATRDIKKDIMALRDAKTFDAGMSNKGVAVVEHLINHLELLIHHYESLRDRIAASSELQQKYPNAVARINAAEEKITADIETLEAAMEDGKITREEWQKILPIIKSYGKERSELRSNEQYREIRKAHIMDFTDKFRRESLPKVRARLKARGMADTQVQERVATIESELTRIQEANNDDRMDALNRIREALA